MSEFIPYSPCFALYLLLLLLRSLCASSAPVVKRSTPADCLSTYHVDRLLNYIRPSQLHMKNLPQGNATEDAFGENYEFAILPARKKPCSTDKSLGKIFGHLRGTKNPFVKRTIPGEARVTTQPGLWQEEKEHLQVGTDENGKTTFRSGVPASVGQCRSSWKCFQDPTRYPPQRDQAVLLGVSESGAQRPCYCKGLKNNTEVIRYFCEPYGMLVPVLSLEPQTPCPAGGSSSAERVWRMTMEKTTVGFYCGSFGVVVNGTMAWDRCPNQP